MASLSNLILGWILVSDSLRCVWSGLCHLLLYFFPKTCILLNQNFLWPQDIIYTSLQLRQSCQPLTLLLHSKRSSVSKLGQILLIYFEVLSIYSTGSLTALKHIPMRSLPHSLSVRIRNQGRTWRRWTMPLYSTPTESWKTTKTCKSCS